MDIKITNIDIAYNETNFYDGLGIPLTCKQYNLNGYNVRFILNESIDCVIFIYTDKEMELKEIRNYIENQINIEKG